MPYEPSRGVYRFIDEELNVPRQAGGHRAKQPLPRRDIEAAARQKNQRNNSRLPPEAYPQIRQRAAIREDEEETDVEDDYPPRMPTVTRRYDRDIDELPTQRGRRVDHYHTEPFFTERQPGERRTHAEPKRRQRIHVHWLTYVGIGLLLMLVGYIALNLFGSWWTNHQDDVTYGNPRTFHIDAVVGHNDSPAHPSHFIAMNLKGHVIVIELPGGDVSRARSYNITTIPDNTFNPPVRLAFQDLTNDGRLDMVIEIGDPGSVITIFSYNNGAQFVPKL